MAAVPRRPTSRQIEAELELSGLWSSAPDEVLVAGPAGIDALRWLLEHAEAAQRCRRVWRVPVMPRSSLTAQYTTQREQFGKPIATFQAVGQRAADAYIDAEAVRAHWRTWQAACED